jgi:uncharacterized protein
VLVERSRIPAEGLDCRLIEEARWEGVEGLWQSLAPVEASFHLERRAEGVLARGAFRTGAVVQCSRCSEPVFVPMADDIEVLYVESTTGVRGEDAGLAATQELNVEPLKDDRIDLSWLLRESVLLSLPLQPLCRPECRGLCPRCGVNLNETACQCRGEATDPRLLPLQHLL